MNAWEQLVDRLTDRLGVDPELRLDVAEELRAHLADSAAQFRRDGQTEAQAAESAARALGDPGSLAEQLWQANRRRIRFRGVLRWAARVALVPAALLVVVAIVLGLRGVRGSFRLDPDRPLPVAWAKTLGSDQQFILRGDPAVRTWLDRTKSIADRWPDDAVCYGDYVTTLMAHADLYDRSRNPRPERLAEMLAALDKGERIDPDNAFYNFTKAAWLVQSAGTLSEDAARTYETTDRAGKAKVHRCWSIEIYDEARFARGLAELHRGLGKPECSSRSIEMLQRRLDLLPAPDRLNDHVQRLALQVSVLLVGLNDVRRLGRAASAYAIRQAEAGRADEATAAIRDVAAMAAKIGARARTLIGLLTANAIRREALGHAEQVHKQLGQAEQARQAHEQLSDETAFLHALHGQARSDLTDLPHMGLFWSVLKPSLPGYRFNPEPMRSAEHAVAGQLALLALLGALVGLALLGGAATVWQLLWRRGKDRPVLLFVGWRRIGRICPLAIVVPLAAYALWAHVLTSPDREYGLNYTSGKTLLEYAVVFGVILTLLIRLSYAAIRARSEEIGLTVPAPLRLRDRKWLAGAGALLAVVSAVYVIGWWAGPFKPATIGRKASLPGVILAAAVGAYLLIGGLREWAGLSFKARFGAFRQTLYRSMVPILAATVIVVGAICGAVLARTETSAARRIRGLAAIQMSREIDRSEYRRLRDRLAAAASAGKAPTTAPAEPRTPEGI